MIPSEALWLYKITRQVRGIGSSNRRPLDGEQTGLVLRLGAFPATSEEKWWTRLNGVVDFINKNHSFPKESRRQGIEERTMAQWCAPPTSLIAF